MTLLQDLSQQVLRSIGYYVTILFLVRMGGKRLAGQTTTYDLIILISLGVVLQTLFLPEGQLYACVFVLTVFVVHKIFAILCQKYDFIRHIVRGSPQRLIQDGKILYKSLEAEGMNREELLAGLRKLGYENEAGVQTAVLEETGHISAVPISKD